MEPVSISKFEYNKLRIERFFVYFRQQLKWKLTKSILNANYLNIKKKKTSFLDILYHFLLSYLINSRRIFLYVNYTFKLAF